MRMCAQHPVVQRTYMYADEWKIDYYIFGFANNIYEKKLTILIRHIEKRNQITEIKRKIFTKNATNEQNG